MRGSHGDRIMVDRLYLFTIFNALIKGKSDYVKKPIPEIALEGIWERMNQLEVEIAELQFSAYGGRMNEVSESSLPFPHKVVNPTSHMHENQTHLCFWNESLFSNFRFFFIFVFF